MALAFASTSRRIIHRALSSQKERPNFQRCFVQWEQKSCYSNTRLASMAAPEYKNPGSMISGVTAEDIAKDAKLKAFLDANFPILDDSSGGGRGSGGIKVSVDELRDIWGLTDDEVATFVEDAAADEDDEDEIPEYDRVKIDSGLGTPEQQALNIRVLHTYLRQEDGSNSCRWLRWQKMIPGVLYGGDDKSGAKRKTLLQTQWPELQRELARYHRQFESRVYDLTVYQDETDTVGTVHRVLPRNVQRHPIKGQIYCANFLVYDSSRPVKIPIVYVNQEESPALKRDGFIIPINRFVDCLIDDGVSIPEYLELDCTGAQVKEVMRLNRILLPEGVRPSKKINVNTFVVGPVSGGKGGPDEDDAAAEK
jgi:large subunit ribosomal protein L25